MALGRRQGGKLKKAVRTSTRKKLWGRKEGKEWNEKLFYNDYLKFFRGSDRKKGGGCKSHWASPGKIDRGPIRDRGKEIRRTWGSREAERSGNARKKRRMINETMQGQRVVALVKEENWKG